MEQVGARQLSPSTQQVVHDLIAERGLTDWSVRCIDHRDVIVGRVLLDRLQDNRLQRKRKQRSGAEAAANSSADARERTRCGFVVLNTTQEPTISMDRLLDLYASAKNSILFSGASPSLERVYLCLTDAGNIRQLRSTPRSQIIRMYQKYSEMMELPPDLDLQLDVCGATIKMVLTFSRVARTVLSRPLTRRRSVLSGISEDLLISTSIGHQIGGASHTALVDSLVKTNVVAANSRLERALRAVDRGAFAPLKARSTGAAYENRPLKIGVVATISTPQQHAQVMGLLEEHLQPGATALDVGCGSGYLVAIMAHLVGATGNVTGVDIVPELVEFSKQNLQHSLDEELLPATSIVQTSSKEVLGDLPSDGLFDAIHVGVAVETKAEAEQYLDFLTPGGGLLIPLGRGGEEQKLVKMTKHTSGDVTKVDVMSVLCQPILDDVPVLQIQETRPEKAARLEKELKQWREEFEARHQRRPTRDDMMGDATAKQLFTEFATIKK